MLRLSLLLVASMLLVPDSSSELFGASFVYSAANPDDISAPPFEVGMEIPEAQKQKHLDGFAIIELLQEIALVAIEQRNNRGSGFSIMYSYGKKLRAAIYKWEEELKTIPLDQCKKPSSDYYFNCATLVEEEILKKSDEQMAGVDRNAEEAQLNTDEMITRVLKYFNNLKTALTNSPSGAYLDWKNLTFNGVRATDGWREIYNDLRVLGYDRLTKLLGSNLIDNLRYHGEERKLEESPIKSQPKSRWGFGGMPKFG